jgi:hypothetical protein
VQYDAVAHCKYLLFADDFELYSVIKSAEDCNLLQPDDVNSIQGWCTDNYTKLNITKTKVMSFSRITSVLIYDYKFCQSSMTRTDSIKNLGIFNDAKRHFPNHVSHIFLIALSSFV